MSTRRVSGSREDLQGVVSRNEKGLYYSTNSGGTGDISRSRPIFFLEVGDVACDYIE